MRLRRRSVETLDEAQEAELEQSVRTLRLRPGRKLLDVGCRSRARR
ncbi:MAG: class I SAM-dependent methyltransferase [Trueperaceae bacterium]|nr:class I SAM-dependent methyltransferase [Trueperaceae bacterium]